MTNYSKKSPKNLRQREICSQLIIEQCLARRVLCICNIILSHPLFLDIPREETHKLSAISDLIKLQKGEKLFFRNAPIEHIYFVLEGKLKLINVDQNSDKVFMNKIADVGDAIALESLFSDLERFADTAEALEATTVLLLNKNKLKKIILANPVIMRNLLGFVSEQVNDLDERLRDQIFVEVPERLLKFLNNHDGFIDNAEISRGDLAHLLGTIPATLSRAIKRLKDTGQIIVNKDSISAKIKSNKI